MRGLDALLDLLPPRVLVCGKGGVGKTTCASALAARAAARGRASDRTLLLSTDPARSLGDATGVHLGGDPVPLPWAYGLYARQLDPGAARSRFLEQWRTTLVDLFDRGTYLNRGESEGIIDAALPGLDESMALLTMLDIEDAGWTRVVLDTAPTGHTLRLLQLPESFSALLTLLDAMQEKHRFMVHALTHRYREDSVDRFLHSMHARLDRFRAALADPARYAVVLVVRAEPLVVDESVRYAAELAAMGLAPRAVIVNALPGDPDGEGIAAVRELERALPEPPRFDVELFASPPTGSVGLGRWGELVREHGSRVVGSSAASIANQGDGDRFDRVDETRAATRTGSVARGVAPRGGGGAALAVLPAIAAPLTIVAGKGGVGKTTTACALAIALADTGAPTLLVSTDPAPSIADALAQPVGDGAVAVDGAGGLSARQLDASAAFASFRARYVERVDRLFDSLMRGTMDAAHDRAVVRDLLALAPPGIDELYALSVLGEQLAEGSFARIVVDPAPTGHLLRLLELPTQAVEWAHRLLRLMLDYREVVPLGEAAEELLDFARRTRALEEQLRDRGRTSVLLVALDEPLVREETVRLAERIDELGIAVAGVYWNRAGGTGIAPLPLARSFAQFELPVTRPAPRGVQGLREWSAAWRNIPNRGH